MSGRVVWARRRWRSSSVGPSRCGAGAACWPPTTWTASSNAGYSLTLRADGSLVRSAGDMAPGASIVTRLADGTVHSTVDSVEETGRDDDVQGLGSAAATNEDGAA